MMSLILMFLCQYYKAISMDVVIQVPEYQSGKDWGGVYLFSYPPLDNEQVSVDIAFQFEFAQIPKILLSISYHYEEHGINGFMVQAENITQTQFTLVYTSFTSLYKYYCVDWVAINDQTICVHYACFEPNQTNYEFPQIFNNTYYWESNPIGALFITGQYKMNFNNELTYRIGANLTQISMSAFYYTFIYESTDYKICIHSIFSPPEFLMVHPNIMDQTNNHYDEAIILDLLEIPKTTSSVYLGGFTSYFQSSTLDQQVEIYTDENYQYLYWSIFEATAQISILRILYIPFNCSLSLETTNFTNSTGTYCECQTGYYFADYTQLCQQCLDSCIGCEYSPENCNECGINQTLTENSIGTQNCVCNTTYYLTLGTNCELCDTSCINCDISPTNCTSCGSNQTLSNNQCSCNDGYYLITGTSCGICSTSCQNCIFTPTTCTSCGLDQYLNNNQCYCTDGYYLISGTQCGLCDTNCINCLGSPTNCTSCEQNQTLNNNQCSCDDGYYLISGTQCGLCDTSCLTCVSTPTTCTSCGLYLNLNNSKCSCSVGYYLISGTQCGQCDCSCQTCQSNYNICTSCGLNAELDQINCICDAGFFRGEETDCLKCDASCLLCQSLDLCTSCQQGYYFDTGKCHACDKNCLTCDSVSTKCEQCKQDANLNDHNQCICNSGYYIDTNDNCLQCAISCETCTGPSNSQCTKCSVGKILRHSQCVCADSQYIDNQGKCQQCADQCSTCLDHSSCLTCKPNLNNYFNDGQCLSCKEKAAMNVDICNYADCTDQVWTKGEQCDDGNDIDRDGCTNCQIDTNYKCINAILEQSFCYTCSNGCVLCSVNSQQQIICSQCQDGYYIDNNQCLQCSTNCVTCSSYRCCLKCLVLGFVPDPNGRCPQCEDNAGFYTIVNQCQTKCGDSIIAGIEECDDGNLMNGDGCSQNCILEQGYILQNGKPYQIPVPNSSVQYVNSTSLTNFTINTDQSDPNICSVIKISIDYYNTSAYNYTIFATQNTQEDQISCLIQFNFTQSLNSTSLMRFQIPYSIQSSRRLLDYLYREVIIAPRNVIVYSQSQISQAESVQGTGSTLTFALYFIGPGTVLLGGFECFFRILDILSWINNLNFINIQYPLNVGMLLQNSGWASVELIPQFIQFNQPGDPYYTESPRKFMDLGVDPLFINNAYQSVSIIFVIIACHLLASTMELVMLLFLKTNKSKQHKQQTNTNIISDVLTKFMKFNENFISHLIQGFNLAFLDLVLAIVMQIIYFNTNMLHYQPVLMSYLLALCSIIIISLIIILSWLVSNKHSKLLSCRSYQNKFGFFYEDINKQSKIALKYNVFNLFRKSLFIINLIVFYNTPLLQAPFCCIISLFNIILILYEIPFENRKAFISNVVPDFCIFCLMLISSCLALDDQISQLTASTRFFMGWIMLGLIAISIFIQLFYVFQSFIERSQWIYKSIFV